MPDITAQEFQKALKAASKGDVSEQVRVGDCYRDGICVAQDERKAIEWYRKAANQRDPEGQVRMGKCFEEGIGVKENAAKALEWYIKAAKQGHSKGQRAVGDWYEYEGEDNDDQDEANAFEWYKKAADQGDPEGQVRVGECFEDGTGIDINEHEAFVWYMKSAEQGYAEGCYKVGICYENGIGVDPNIEQAFVHYIKSAYKGYPLGQEKIGEYYLEGVHVERNEKEALSWFSKAAEQGNADGEDYIGICYLNGYGVEKDEQIAFSWFLKASQGFSFWGMIHAGNCLRNGIGVEKDGTKAFELYYKAADFGFSWGMAYVGECFQYGTGVEADEIEAFSWYLKAANEGNVFGCERVGDCLMNGTGVDKDEECAYGWYRKAAEQGYPDAQRKVGECLASGSGVDKDEFEAFKWFERAAEQEDSNAQNELGNCYLKGIGVEKNEKKAVEWYEKAIEQKNPDAQGSLLAFYLSYKDRKKAYKVASDFILRRAIQGDWNCQAFITMLCHMKADRKLSRLAMKELNDDGDIVEFIQGISDSMGEKLDDEYAEMAFEWMEKAANNGNEYALQALSFAYSHGVGVQKDKAKAFGIDMRIAELGDAEDIITIGCRFMQGDGVEKDGQKAFEWFSKAADQGDADGVAYVGFCYLSAIGVEENKPRAFKKFFESAEQESAIGMIMAGLLYWEGKGIAQDDEKALEMFIRVIRLGKENPNFDWTFYFALFSIAFLGKYYAKLRLRAEDILEEVDPIVEPAIELFIHLLNNDFSSLDDCRSLFELCVKHREDSGGCAYILLTIFSLSTNSNVEIFDNILERNDLRSYTYYRKALQLGFVFHFFDDEFSVNEADYLNYKMAEALFDWTEEINPDKVHKALSDCFKHLSSRFRISVDDFCKKPLGENEGNEYVFNYFKNWDPEEDPNFINRIEISLKCAGITRKTSTNYEEYDSLSYKRDRKKKHFLKTLEAEGIKLESLTTEELKECIRIYLPSLGKGARERLFKSIVFPTKRFSVLEDEEGRKNEEEENSDGKKNDHNQENLMPEAVFFREENFIASIKEIVQEMEKTQYVQKWVKRSPTIGTCVLACLLYEQINETFHKEDIIQILGESEYFTYNIGPLFELFERKDGKVATAKEICSLIGETEGNYSQRKEIIQEKFLEAYDMVIGKNYYLD